MDRNTFTRYIVAMSQFRIINIHSAIDEWAVYLGDVQPEGDWGNY